MMDVHRLIGEVAKRHGIRVEPGDPAFALVTLNQLVLEDAFARIGQNIGQRIAEFTEAVQKTEARAGKLLALEVKEAAAEIREELQRDIETARVGAREILYEVHRKDNRMALVRWAIAGLSAAGAVFASGIWVGVHIIQ